jgi:hypothetical protein
MILEKDQLFVPTGFDSESLINELSKNVTETRTFEEVFAEQTQA